MTTSFVEYLTEINKKEAMEILGISSKDSNVDLKKIYKKASMKHHPDKGGSTEMMQKVNLAYDLLKGSIFGNGQELSRQEKKNKDIEENKLKVDLISRFIRESFNITKYKTYFEKYFKGELTVDIKERKNISGYASDSYGITYTFHSKDSETVFYINISVWALYAVNFVKSLGGGEDGVSFEFSTDNYLYHKRRKQKMKQRTWSRKGNTLEINDPKKLFPMKTMKAVFEGKKQRKFSKRDFVSGISKVMKGSFDGIWGRIPLIDNIRLTLTRNTFMRTGYWMINGIYENGARKFQIKGVWSIPESEEGLDMLIKLVKELKKQKNVDKMSKIVNTYETKFKDMK